MSRAESVQKSLREEYAKRLRTAFANVRGAAPRRGRDFQITMDHLVDLYIAQEMRCAVTGIGMHYFDADDFHKAPFAPSVDRINNNLGYVPGNVRLVCAAANIAIGEWGEEIFGKLARGYVRAQAAKRAKTREHATPPV